jgi:hypothetical protein
MKNKTQTAQAVRFDLDAAFLTRQDVEEMLTQIQLHLIRGIDAAIVGEGITIRANTDGTYIVSENAEQWGSRDKSEEEVFRAINKARGSLYLAPIVGMGMTYHIGGDSYPYTVVRVSPSGKTFWAKPDRYRVTGDVEPSEHRSRSVIVEVDTDVEDEEELIKVTWRKRGHHKRWGWQIPNNSHVRISLGVRSHKRDPHF